MEKFEKYNLYFANVIKMGRLEEPIEYRMECEKVANENYVDGTFTHLARTDAWTDCEASTTDTEVERDGQRQKSLPTLYGRYMRRAVASVLSVAWEAVSMCLLQSLIVMVWKMTKGGRCAGIDREKQLWRYTCCLPRSCTYRYKKKTFRKLRQESLRLLRTAL